MAKQQSDSLFRLIKSMSKAEKRNFKLYAKRGGNADDLKFITLFDIIDRQTEYDESEILAKASAITPAQLPNLKANLTKNLMVSLRLMAQQTDAEINIRQQIDFAKILYNKALYQQSLATLDKARQMASKNQCTMLYYEIVDFEKQIESQYINANIDDCVERFNIEAELQSQRVNTANALSNLAIRLYGYFLRNGYIRNQTDQQMISDYFHLALPIIKFEDLTLVEQMNYCQAYFWYYLVNQDFLNAFRYSSRWVAIFHNSPDALVKHPEMYIKGLNNLLDGLYFTKDFERFNNSLNELVSLRERADIVTNKNVELLLSQYYYTHRINWFFMQGLFDDGVKIIPDLLQFISDNEHFLDNHTILIFYYKIASLYFGNSDYHNTVKYLSKVINYKDPDLRSDIQCFARILNLISHYELENLDLVDYLIKSTFRFLSKMKDLHRVQKEMIFFLRRLPKVQPGKLNDAFVVLYHDLLKLQDDPFERRPFLYLDVISWLESKIYKIPVQQVIRTKFLSGTFALHNEQL